MHYYGVMREDEAVFHAYVAAKGADSAYLRYCAAICALGYLGKTLYALSYEKYCALMSEADTRVTKSLSERRDFANKALQIDVADTLRDGAMHLSDSRGVDSYNGASRLIVRYLLGSQGSGR